VAHPDDDLYDGNHGRYVLEFSPGQEPMGILPFSPVKYDKMDHTMKAEDPNRKDDFISISGSKMRALAAAGAVPCDVSGGKEIPSDLLAANCIPPGFMVQSGWEIVCNYYQNVESDEWVPYAIMTGDPMAAHSTKHEGTFGTMGFKLYPTKGSDYISPWHDVPLMSSNGLYNFIVEIPMYNTAKMEVMKNEPGNPIMQDNKNNKPRFYTYGVPFFNYGLLPQTWEDPTVADPSTGAMGDGDPIDVIEIGVGPLAMGSIVPVKILGSMELIDEGETDHKIIALREDDPDFDSVHSVADLERVRPGVTAKLVDWLKNYKTSDGKPVNRLKQETPTSVSEAVRIVEEVSGFYQNLISGTTPNTWGYFLPK
jgi:3'-phosphoadenosine 5'-phosphosulfate synthase